jgi:hypothetical protein
MKVLLQIFGAFVGEAPVVPLPGELLGDVSARLQRLEELENMKVRDIGQFAVFGESEVLLGGHHTI